MDSNHQYPEEKLPAINTAALRATENVLKVICDGKGWNYDTRDSFERLLAIVQSRPLF